MNVARAYVDPGLGVWVVLVGLVVLSGQATSAERILGEEASVRWQSIELARSDGITVRLLVKEEASAADQRWMKIEYENTTGDEVLVRDPHYVMNYEAFDLATGRRLRSGGLASGPGFDVARDPPKKASSPTVLLPPGRYDVGDEPSSYATALLGPPPRTGMRIKVVALFWARMPDQTRLGSLTQGVSLEFSWLFPDDASIEAMRERLKGMLNHGQEHYYQTYLLGALLDFPGVGDALDIGEVLEGFRIRKGAVDGRQTMAKYINASRATDLQVKEFFLRALKERDRAAVDDLAYFAPDVWDDRFVPLLVRMCERARHPADLMAALMCLDRHSEEWKDDQTTPGRLSEAAIRLSPTAAERPEDLDEQNSLYWRTRVMLLAMTRDQEVIPLLRPFLDSPIVVQRFVWDPVRPSPVPARACDIAYNAIQAILGHGDNRIDLQDWDGPVRLTEPLTPEEAAEVEKELARRDETVRALRASLDPL